MGQHLRLIPSVRSPLKQQRTKERNAPYAALKDAILPIQSSQNEVKQRVKAKAACRDGEQQSDTRGSPEPGGLCADQHADIAAQSKDGDTQVL